MYSSIMMGDMCGLLPNVETSVLGPRAELIGSVDSSPVMNTSALGQIGSARRMS